MWPETAPGPVARVQPLSAGPTPVDREMTTEAQASGIFWRHHLLQHTEKQFPATPRGKRLDWRPHKAGMEAATFLAGSPGSSRG